MSRCFNTRVSKHKHDLNSHHMDELKKDELNKKTSLAKHCFKYEHKIDFVNFEILNFNIDFDKRKFLESLYINIKNLMNEKNWNVFSKIYHNVKIL